DDAAHWCADGLRYAREHPGHLPVVLAARFLRTWSLWPAAFWRTSEGRQKTVERLGKGWILAALVAPSIRAARPRDRRRTLAIVAAPIATPLLAGLLGWGLPRLQAGALPSIVVLAAIAIVSRTRTWRARMA